VNPIRHTRPGGIIPILAIRQLPQGSAQVAANVELSSGEWVPLRKSVFAWSPPLSLENLLSIARLDASTWLAWTTPHVRVERSPLQGEQRYVISGHGIPKTLTKAMALPVSGTGSPASTRALGIPTPVAVVTVTPTGGIGSASTRSYTYTFVSDWSEESSPAEPSAAVTGKVDDSWALAAMDTTPTNGAAVINATKTVSTVSVETDKNHYLRVGDETSIASVLGMTDLNGVRTVTAIVSPKIFTVALATAQTYTSGGTWARTVPWAPCTKRIYRTVGSTGDFQLVAEGVAGATYADTIADVDMPGDSIVSEGWVPPPPKLTGIVSMPNGMLAGFIEDDRVVCFCEPYQPHAWPEAYKRTLPDNVVGAAAFGSNLGVATAGMPHVFTGTDPAALSSIKHEKPFPCVSRDSVSSVADGVVFATGEGLARMDISGVVEFTQQLWSAEQWSAMQPSGMSCAFDGKRLFISTPVEDRLFTLNLVAGGALVTAYRRLQATYVDPQSGRLFYALGHRVFEFNALGAAPQVLDWMSAEYVLPKPANIGAVKLERDAAFVAVATAALAAERAAIIAANQATMALPAGGRGGLNGRGMNVIEINGSILEQLPDAAPAISFSFYSKGQLVYSQVVPDDRGFRLPGGFKTDRYAIRLQANTQVSAVVLADTPRSLAVA